MHATRMTFCRVAKGGTVTPPALDTGVANVSDFLVAHAASLRERAAEGSTANATFVPAVTGGPAGAEQLMQDIRCGDDTAFLSAAGTLNVRLVDAMGKVGNAASGLLVCATVVDDASPPNRHAVILKLVVVSEQGAAIQKLGGVESLAAVKDLLDQPGDLQKGLVYPDVRPGSRAVVGDKSGRQEAKYFLDAVGVVLEMHGSKTAGALVQAVTEQTGPQVAAQVVRVLPSIPAGTPDEVLGVLRLNVPELSEQGAATAAAALESDGRPVRQVDTAAPVKGTIKAGQITIAGPPYDIADITWTEDVSGGWTVTFHSDTEPTRSWR